MSSILNQTEAISGKLGSTGPDNRFLILGVEQVIMVPSAEDVQVWNQQRTGL